MTNEELIENAIVYYKELGGLYLPSKEESSVTTRAVQLRDANGELIAEYSKSSEWLQSGKYITKDSSDEGDEDLWSADELQPLGEEIWTTENLNGEAEEEDLWTPERFHEWEYESRESSKNSRRKMGHALLAIAGIATIALAAGSIAQLIYHRTSNPEYWRGRDILRAAQSVIGITHQRRFLVLEEVSCNLEHVNAKIRQADSLFGFDFGGVFGYKTKCADGGYSDNESGPFNMRENLAIITQCQTEGYSDQKSLVDDLLRKGAKMVSSKPLSASVSVYKTKGQTVSDVSAVMYSKLVKREKTMSEEQFGNYCIGTEYVLEGSPLVLDDFGR